MKKIRKKQQAMTNTGEENEGSPRRGIIKVNLFGSLAEITKTKRTREGTKRRKVEPCPTYIKKNTQVKRWMCRRKLTILNSG